MIKVADDIEQILPFGESLRTFMEQSFITKSDLKDLLRSRGVFTNNSEKGDTIPILSSTLLSPSEFDYLRECQNSKEDNPKIITQTIEWKSEESLLDSIPEKFDVNSVLDLEYTNFKVVSSPIFVPINNDPNNLRIDFLIERQDMSKSWANNKSLFPGSLELKKIEEGNEIKLVITHTANETKYVATKVSTGLVKNFKEKGHINPSKNIEKILFSKFSNSRRIEYLLCITKNCKSNILEFKDIVDIEFSPDPENPLPDGINWMEEKIEDLKLNGNKLHQTFFVSDKNYHDFLHFYSVASKFKFDIKGRTGECVILMGFPDYGRDKNYDAEMEVNIRNMSFDIFLKGSSISEIKQILLKEIENQKIANFKSFSISQEIES